MKLNPETLARASSRPSVAHGHHLVGDLHGGGRREQRVARAGADERLRLHEQPRGDPRAEHSCEQEKLQQNVAPETFVMMGGPGAPAEPGVRGAGERCARRPPATRSKRRAHRSGCRSPCRKQDAANPQVAALGPIASEDGTAVLFNVVLTDDTDKTATIVDGLNSIRDSVQHGRHDHVHAGRADLDRRLQEDLGRGPPEGRDDGRGGRDHRPDRRVRGAACRRDADRAGHLRDLDRTRRRGPDRDVLEVQLLRSRT